MIGFLLSEMLPSLGMLFGETLLAPVVSVVASVAALAVALAACCCFAKCLRCQARDCLCLKRLFLWSGHDKFDDFELMVMVHEAIFEKVEDERSTMVRVTAGRHSAKTDTNCKGIFQQPLHLLVEQGTEYVVVDLLDRFSRVLASLTLDVTLEIINVKNHSERVYNMKRRDKKKGSPKVKLSMVVNTEQDMEQGLLLDKKSEIKFLVQQQFLKCGEGLSEAEVLKKSSAGPLELLESMGNSKGVWVAVHGPPSSKRWTLSIWKDKHDCDNKKCAIQEVDLLRIQSVQADSTLQHVFEISYYDESRLRQTLTFRCMDRARDVWVEILHLLVQRAYESRLIKKSQEVRSSMKRDKKSQSSGEKYSRITNNKLGRDEKTEK